MGRQKQKLKLKFYGDELRDTMAWCLSLEAQMRVGIRARVDC